MQLLGLIWRRRVNGSQLDHQSVVRAGVAQDRRKNPFDGSQEPLARLVPALLPALDGTLIHAEPLGQLPPRQPQDLARRGKLLQGIARLERVVSQEADDARGVANRRGGFVAFPVGDGGHINADLFGDMLLQESEVQTFLAEVIS